jgi:uncharacterized membrane protein YbhN (UPF0104 family)
VLHQILHAIEVFWDHLAAVDFRMLGIALALHVAKVLVRCRAWQNILKAAFPGSRVRWRHVTGAYFAGVGVNAIVPARGGDAVKLFLLKRRIEGSTYPTLASSLFAETFADLVIASILLTWAFFAGVLPGLSVLPNLPSIDWYWPAHHPRATLAIAVVLILLLVAGLIWANRKVAEFRARVAQGVAIFRDRPAYISGVVSWQLLSWALRLGSVFFFLLAFHIDATIHDALAVQVADSLATVLPFSPGGVGTKQGLLVYMLRGRASGTALLSFSVGMHVAVTVVNVVLGAIAMFLMHGSLKFRRTIRDAQSAEASP